MYARENRGDSPEFEKSGLEPTPRECSDTRMRSKGQVVQRSEIRGVAKDDSSDGKTSKKRSRGDEKVEIEGGEKRDRDCRREKEESRSRRERKSGEKDGRGEDRREKRDKDSKRDKRDRDSRREKEESRSRRERRNDGRDERRRHSHRDRHQKEERQREVSLGESSRGEKRGRDRDDVPAKNVDPPKKKKIVDDLTTKSEGAYIPPARRRMMMQKDITDKSSVAFQRLAWEALKKSIIGLVNKVNISNIAVIVRELFKENLIRGRGLLCRSIMQTQSASPTFTNVFAAVVAVVNAKFPNIGELLLKRLIIQFRRGYMNVNDKPDCLSAAKFVAHLVNQQVVHEAVSLEILTLLLEHPTEDSVEVAIVFLKDVGSRLEDVSPIGIHAVFERLRHVLHEGHLDKRVQYMIEIMFQVRKDKFKDFPALEEDLDLVEEKDQFTHLLTLDEATDGQDALNEFKLDDEFTVNEEKYATLKKKILDESDSGEEGGEEDDDEEDAEDEEAAAAEKEQILDKTETNLVALRRTIYLTIQSSLVDFEECAQKLLQMNLKEGQETELCAMIVDCCAQQGTYEKFFGLLAQRFCNLNRKYQIPYKELFRETYATVHHLDTNKLRNVAKFFAHLLFTDAITWEVLQHIRLTDEDTTSSSRIFIKILFQELAEYMGLPKLRRRLCDPTIVTWFEGVFPRDLPQNSRFSINFFTSIGLGGLTDELREHLKKAPKPTDICPSKTRI